MVSFSLEQREPPSSAAEEKIFPRFLPSTPDWLPAWWLGCVWGKSGFESPLAVAGTGLTSSGGHSKYLQGHMI